MAAVQKGPRNIAETDVSLLQQRIAKNIKKLRSLAGISRDDVARMTGATVSSVNKWEAGITTPRLAWLVSLAKLYDVDVADLFKTQDG